MPAPHPTQAAETVNPVPVPYVPASQLVHVTVAEALSALEYLPAPQAVQVAELEGPKVADQVPAEHQRQAASMVAPVPVP